MRWIHNLTCLPPACLARIAIMPPSRLIVPSLPLLSARFSLACSGESHDTAGGSSQRSVLTGARASSAAGDQQSAKVALLVQAAGAMPAPSKAAWGKATEAVGKQGGGPRQQGGQKQHLPPPDIDGAAFPPLAATQPPAMAPRPQPPSSLSSSGEPPAAPSVAACSSAPSPQPPMPAAQGVPAGLPRAAAGQEAAAVLAAEVAALRAEVARLQLQQQQTDSLHQRVSSGHAGHHAWRRKTAYCAAALAALAAIHGSFQCSAAALVACIPPLCVQELAAVLEDTAAHEAAAVAEAVAAERLNCIYRFAGVSRNFAWCTGVWCSAV